MLSGALLRTIAAAVVVHGAVNAPAFAQTIDLESAPHLRAVEAQRLGSTTDPNLGFTSVSGIAIDRDGSVYVFDFGVYGVKVFSAEGRLIRTIGRQGQGPGEFETAATPGIKGDTLWVRTRGAPGCATRVVLFKRDGTYLSSTNVIGPSVVVRSDQSAYSAPIDMLGDGRMISGEYSCYTGVTAAGSRGGGRGGSSSGGGGASPAITLIQGEIRVPRVLFNLATGKSDTVGWFTRLGQVAPPPPRKEIQIEGRAQPIPVAPRDEQLAVPTRDGRFLIDRTRTERAGTANIRLVRTNVRGDTVSNISLRYEPVRYDAATLDSVAAQAVKFPGGAYRVVNGVPQVTPYNNPRAAAAALRTEMRFPQFQMPVTRAVAGGDGTLWLRREDRGGGMVLWHIVEQNGQLRGTVSLPARSNPTWMSGSTLWVVHQDEDDVPWLVRYTISRG